MRHRHVTTFWVLSLAIALTAVHCAAPQTPAPQQAPEPQDQTQDPAQTAAAPAEPVPPPSTDLSGEIMGTLVISSLDDVLQRGTAYLLPHLPPPFQAMAKPEALKAEFFKGLESDGLENALDTTRPMALAVLDPTAHREDAMGPLMMAIPVNDPDLLIGFLGRKAASHEATQWKDHMFTLDTGRRFLLRFQGPWAYLATTEPLLFGAHKVFQPLLADSPTHAARIRVDMEAIYKKHGAEIEGAVTQLENNMQSFPAEQVSLMSMARRWLGYLAGISALDIHLDLEPQDIRLAGAAKAKTSGAFYDFLAQQNAGAPWGAKFLPKESVMLVLGREDPQSRLEDVDLALQTLKGILKDYVDEATVEGWGEVIKKAQTAFSGETAGSFWVTPDGGIGMASAALLKDPKTAQKSMTKLMSVLSQEIKRFLTKGLSSAEKKDLKGFNLKLAVRPGAVRVPGAKGDLYELVIRWPRLKNKTEREELEKVKKAMAKVVGPRLSIAFVTVGDVGLMTMGKGHRKQLAKMVAIAKGGKGTGTEALVQRLVGSKKMLALVYSPLATLAEGVLRVAGQVTTLPPHVQTIAHNVLPGPGKEVPASALLYIEDQSMIFEGSLSPDIVGMIAKGVMQVMSAQGGMSPMP